MNLEKASILAALLTVVTVGPLPALATSGISGANLSVTNTETVPTLAMEFEPFFALAYELGAYNDSWSRQGQDGRTQNLTTGYRFTLGVANGLEAGLVTPIVLASHWGSDDVKLSGAGIGDIALGAKWRFVEGDKWSLAWHGGLSLPTGDSRPGPMELATGSGASAVVTGLVTHFQLAADFSLDMNLQATMAEPILDGAERGWSIDFGVALAHTIGPWRLIAELTQNHSGWKEYEASSFTATTGFTYTVNERVIIVTGPFWDFAGRNSSHALGHSLAFTILL